MQKTYVNQTIKIKNAENGHLGKFFEDLKLAVEQCYQKDHPIKGQKLVEKAKFAKFECDILSNFQ